MNMAPEWVGNLPEDIAGIKFLKIRCSPSE